MKATKLLTTHDIVKLNVFKGWNFSLEFKGRSIPQKNGLEMRVDGTGERIRQRTTSVSHPNHIMLLRDR